MDGQSNTESPFTDEEVREAARALCLVIARRRENRRLSNDSATFDIYWSKWQDEFIEDAKDIIGAVNLPRSQSEDARDAARYRWLRDKSPWCLSDYNRDDPEFISLDDETVDAAMNHSRGA